MSRLTAIGLSLFVLCLLPVPVQAQFGSNSGNNTVTLTGTVLSESANRPIAQARVELHDSGGNLISEGSTNESGEFSFRFIQRNTYILNVSAVGYESQDMHVDLSFTSDRGITVILRPVPEKSDSSGPVSSVSAHEMSMPQKARELLASGEKKIYEDKDPKGGLADLQQAVAIAPGFYEAYYQIGMAYLSANQTEEAEKAFLKSIDVSGDKYGEAQVGLGALLLNAGKADEGEKDVRHGIELSPNFWLGYYELGRALMNKNQVADAEKAAEQARSLAPNSPLVYRLLANVHMAEKNYPALLQDLDAYIKLDPDSPAGLRAKQLRDQVAQKVGDQKPAETGSQPK
jgi:tetratricopeptide (TPR) repeat protein